MRHKNASTVTVCLLGIMMLLISIDSPRADVDVDLRGGYYTDVEDPYLGGGILMNLGDSRWYFNPNAEFVFSDDPDLMTLNGDFHYDFTETSEWSFWAGGGPAVIFTDPDPGDSDTDLGLNLLVGTGMRSTRVRPFFQLKGVIADEDDEAVLTAGIRF